MTLLFNRITINMRAHINFLKYSSTLFCFLTFALTYSVRSLASDYGGATNKIILFNTPPVFANSSYTFNIAEDVALGTSAGTASASDADGDVLSYSIVNGNTNRAFSINTSTGSITVAKWLNHHTQAKYLLGIKVTDPSGSSDNASVTINVQAGAVFPDFTTISWGTIENEPYGTHEVHGEAVNGKLYIFGGYDVQKRPKYVPTKRSFVYDPIAKTWNAIADLPHTPNSSTFGGITHEGLTTDGTDIYFAGGYPTNSAGTAQNFGTRQVWRYNVSANNYTSLPNLPTELATGQLKYLQGKLHYIGGANISRRDTSIHYALDLDNLSAGWKVLAPVLNATNHPGSAVYEDKIYFIGGAHKQDAASIKQKTVQVYDPATNSWQFLADLPTPLDHISSSVIVMGSRIIVLGGESAPNVKSQQVLAYSPAGNSWASLTPMLTEKSAGVATFLNGALYYAGGNYSNVNSKGLPSSILQIDSYTLINADNEQPIKTIVNGETINLASLSTTNLNIRANTGSSTKSVKFDLTGTQTKNAVDNQSPYSLFGDNAGNYSAWTPAVGSYTLKGTPYSASGATGTAGVSNTVGFSVSNSSGAALTLAPTADASVRGGTYASTNYGSDPLLNIKGSSSSSNTRFFYIKFSVSGLSSVSTAKLRLHGSNITNNSQISVAVYGVNSDSWTESAINFNNAPTNLSGLLSSIGVSNTSKYYEFDVSSFVKTQFTGDKIVTLLVRDDKKAELNLAFNSRENGNDRPQLVINGSSQIAARSSKSSLISQTNAVNNPLLLASANSKKTRVYPNPLYKMFNIEFPQGLKAGYRLEIVDPVGRIYQLGRAEIQAGNHNNMQIDISKLYLNSGLYFLRIYSSSKQTEVIKLIVR